MSNSSLVTYTNITNDRNSPRNHKIDTITIHCYVGQVTAKQGCDFFKTSDRQVSSNYVVGKDGSIGLSVPESDRAWTTSSPSNDHRAITIECACDSTSPYKLTDKAYNALINLVADICKRNDIKKLLWKNDKSLIGQVDKQNMTVHRWFANTACPGEFLMEHMSDIANKVNAKLGVTTEKKTETTKKDSFLPSKGYFSKGDKSDNVKKISEFMYKMFPSYTNKKAVSSTFNSYLVSSIKEFQKRTKLEADGYIGPLTLAKLETFGFKK